MELGLKHGLAVLWRRPRKIDGIPPFEVSCARVRLDGSGRLSGTRRAHNRSKVLHYADWDSSIIVAILGFLDIKKRPAPMKLSTAKVMKADS